MSAPKFTAFPTVYPYLGNANASSFPPAFDNTVFFPAGSPNFPTLTGERIINLGSYITLGQNGQIGGVAYICSNDPLTNYAFGPLVGPVGIGLMVDIVSNTKSVTINDNAGTDTDNLLTDKIGLPVELSTNQAVTACGWAGFTTTTNNGAGLAGQLNLGNQGLGYIFEFNGGYYLPIAYAAADTTGATRFDYSTHMDPITAPTVSGSLTLSGTMGGQFPIYSKIGAPTWIAAVFGTGW